MARRYAAGFGVTLAEWRTLALLRDLVPMALRDLSLQAGLNKGQVSRVVSGLVARGLWCWAGRGGGTRGRFGCGGRRPGGG